MGMKASNAIATFFKYFVLILVGLIMIYPLLWMISATFKDNSEIFAGIGLWIKNPTLEGYKNALNNFGGSINILQAMLNTYSYVLPKVICTVVSSCIAAYGFRPLRLPGPEDPVQHHAGHPVPASGRPERASVPAVHQVRLGQQPVLSGHLGPLRIRN